MFYKTEFKLINKILLSMNSELLILKTNPLTNENKMYFSILTR